MDADALLDGLTAAQRAAVVSEAAPLCILAGAGSGKTRVLTRRIAYRVALGTAAPEHVLAVTFTRRAAGQLRQRLGACGVATPVAAGTFHGVAFAQLRQWCADRQQRPPVLLEHKARLLGPLLGSKDRRLLTGIEAEISWAQARCLDPSTYETSVASAGRRLPIAAATVADLFARYEADKRRRGVCDLDDLLLRCASVFETDPQFAVTQRWRWQHVFVDEYQDLNPAHDRLIGAWLGGKTDLCVVGDPHQSIYGWNGADPSLLTRFAERYPTATVLQLSENFRSSPEILAAAGAVLTAGVVLAPDRAVPPAARQPGPLPVLTAYASAEDEAAGIARSVRDRHLPGTSWSRIAVLTRTNNQLELLAAAFASTGIPHERLGDRSRTAALAARSLASFAPTLPARTAAVELRLELRLAGATPAGPAGAAGPDEGDRVGEALAEYLDLDPTGTVGGFTNWLRSSSGTSGSDGSADDDAVALSTFHRAKGLEWPVVFVAGLEEGLVPLGPLAEERRLLYVALTRAELELYCSWARRRSVGGRIVERAPSPFLGALQLIVSALAAERQPAAHRPRLRLFPMTTPGASTAGTAWRAQPLGGDPLDDPLLDDPLLDDLRRWRATAARAAGVTPHAVLRDETLAAVAAARPLSHDALVALPGFSPGAARRWGHVLLDAVARHAG